MTTVESIHHVGIAVADLIRSRQFYTTVLCLEEIPRPDFDFDGAWFRVGEQRGFLHTGGWPALFGYADEL